MQKPVTEQELAERLSHPRVTQEDIINAIQSEHYFTAEDGVNGSTIFIIKEIPEELKYLTFCVLVLKNGFTVVGQSACAHPDNYNQDIGDRIAKENAVKQVRSYLGYELRSRLAQEKQGEKQGGRTVPSTSAQREENREEGSTDDYTNY